MSLFQGIHEVRVLRPSGIAVGYFDSWDAALRTIENEPSSYKAAYFTLNPVDPGKLPASITVNPQTLTPTRNTAGDGDILSRTLLLVDLDPARPAGTNSTEAEKQAANDEAERVREYLSSRNWPEPMVCDSGNGWHLQYRIDLPNDDHGTELVRGVLARLHQLFPMVDAGSLTVEQFHALLKELHEPFATMALLSVCLGLRISEALALKWADVDWLGSRLSVRRGIVEQVVGDVKTQGSARTFGLTAELLGRLKTRKQQSDFAGAEDWIFASPIKLGRLPYSYTGVWRELVRAAEAAKIGHLGTHAFRHTHRSWLDAVGTPIAVQQKTMRHTDIRTAMNIYASTGTW